MKRVHVTGASGAGVTTLGRAVAQRLSIPHFDTDDFYWLPTEMPYREKREPADRLRLMREVFVGRPHWVLSGSMSAWADPLREVFDLVVLVSAPTEVRLARLRAREAVRFGAEAIAPGGERHDEFEAFVEWASHYDDGAFTGRSRRLHDAWVADLSCPVLRVEGTRPVDALVDEVVRAIIPR